MSAFATGTVAQGTQGVGQTTVCWTWCGIFDEKGVGSSPMMEDVEAQTQMSLLVWNVQVCEPDASVVESAHLT